MIQLRDIRKTYRTGSFEQVALDGVSLSFRDNEFVAILGQSGSGKTTLLNILGGLDHGDSGDILINGVSTADYSSADWDTYRNHRIGFVFQSYNLIPHQTILANVELALTLSGVHAAERHERALEALRKVGLEEHANKRPSQLSGGQMQRVAIARALINDPDIVLADEPTGALDTETGLQVMDLLSEVAKDRLVIMVTHNPELAESYATRIVRLADGRITQDSMPYEPDSAALMAVPAAGGDNRKRASMSFLTALSLSFKNLMTKKGRTIMTAFAGSIGIMGIAAILALSTGVNNYIAQVEEDTLSSYPLTITKSSYNISGFLSSDTGESTTTSTASSSSSSSSSDSTSGSELIPERTVLADMFAQINSNDLSSFGDYLKSGQANIDDQVNSIKYDYGITPLVYSSDTSSGAVKLNPNSMTEAMTSSTSSSVTSSSLMSSSVFNEMIDDQELLDSQYDVVQGRWAESYDECVLVLNKDGSVSDYTLYSMGILDPSELDTLVNGFMNDEAVDVPDATADFSYDDALNTTFKVVNSSSLYRYNESQGIWTDMSGDAEFMKQAVENGTTLKIVGIVKPNATTTSPALSAGIAYSSDLTLHLMEESASSTIVKQQLANPDVDVFTGKTFEELQSNNNQALDMSSLISVDTDALESAFSFDAGALDTGSMNVDTSSALSEMDMNSVMANMPMPDFSTLNVSLTADQQTQVSAISASMVGGFLPYWFTQHPGETITADTDFTADLQSYLATSDVQTQMQQIALIMGQAVSTQVQALMQDYMTNTFAPYLQNVIQQMVSQMASAMQSAVQQSLSSMGESMSNAVTVDENAFVNAIHFNMTQDDLKSLISNYMNSDSLTYDNNLLTLDYAEEGNPQSISIYPKDFESKDAVLAAIDDYNQQMRDAGEDDKVISYTDIMGTLISSVTRIVNTISEVLIAFVSISLVVSSIMIGIITYISVLERRKEIGILRALGASKRNVASVFNAETIIEGLIAGVFAVVVVLLASIPVNAYVLQVHNVPNVMSLPWTYALVLVVISVLLTLVAGLIPSVSASRRDPVEALRSE